MKTIKTVLHPFYRALQRIGVGRPGAERYLKETALAYERFHALSKTENIAGITFREGECIFRLQDDRQFYFDPHHRAARLYSVPLTGTFESKETEFLRSIVNEGDVCLDVGACFGWYTILLSQLAGPSGSVHAFEPLADNFGVLNRNIQLNDVRNVSLNELALDEATGEQELFLPDIGVSGSFRLHTYDKSYDRLVCETSTLDAYCASRGIERVDFLKADVEGAELNVIRGGVETIRQHRPILMLEIQRHSTELFGYAPMELFSLLENMGYIPHFITEQGRLEIVREPDGELPDHNFIFLQKPDSLE